MTLDQLLTHLPTLLALKERWLVFPPEFGQTLAAAQADQTKHRAEPIALTDGRLALCADLLSEIHPGGLFALPFSRLNPDNFPAVEVMDTPAFLSLVPLPEMGAEDQAS